MARWFDPTWQCVMMNPTDEGKELITVRRIPSQLEERRGRETELLQFIGGGTVWRSYPGFTRQATPMEGMLADFCAERLHSRYKR